MVEFDKKDFANAVREVLKSYSQECGRFTLQLWWSALEKHALNDVFNALSSYCADPEKCRFPPKAGDIVGILEGTKSDRKELAVLAFARVLEGIDTYTNTVFDDPAIHYAISVAFMNWADVGQFDSSQFECQEKRRAFITAYAAFKPVTAYPPLLIGINEQESNGHGSFTKTRYVGDKQKALAVEKGGRRGVSEKIGVETENIMQGLKAVAA